MKTIIICLIVILGVGMLAAETNPLKDYFANPTVQSFAAAWDLYADKLAQDSTQIIVRITLATLANIEASRLTQSILPGADTLSAGSKFQFANLLLAQNKYDDAIDLYEDLNLTYPTWSCPWRHKGEALYSLRRYKDAELSLKQAIATNIEHYDAYVWMAKTQFQLKKYKAALANLETALTLNPEAEESPDETLSDESIRALHEELLKRTGKKK